MEKIWLKQYPPAIPEFVEIPPLTLPQALLASGNKYPNRPAIIYLGAMTTHARCPAKVFTPYACQES